MKKNLDGSLASYDPNYGAVFNLTEEELCEVMAESFYAYVTPNIPVIIALAVVAILIISGIVTAVHGYNTIATISLITCLVGLSALLYLEKNLDTLSYDTILKNSFYQDCFTFRDTDLQKMEEELKGVFSQVSEKLEDVHVTNGVQAENKGRQMLSGA